jgi:hypothetical protein
MTTRHDDQFDAAIRARHDAALERLSPRVRAQLAQRRTAALRGHSAARRGQGFRYAAGFAALCALAIGLHFGTMPAPISGAPAASAASSPPAVSTMLDEDPEFYAWLASDDAQLVAME